MVDIDAPTPWLSLDAFALAWFVSGWAQEPSGSNSLGIIVGLVAGKPIGITLLSFAAVAPGICRLPLDLNWKHVCGAGLLGGIGFTMSIFTTNLAFTGDAGAINASKIAILLASLSAGIIGFIWLNILRKPQPMDTAPNSVDFEVPGTHIQSQQKSI